MAVFLSSISLMVSMVIVIFLFFTGMFSHLNFKQLNIKTIQLACGVVGAIFGFFYFISMYKMIAVYGIYASEVHYISMIGFMSMVIILGLITRRITPNILQMIGLILFGGASYFLLA